MQSKRAVLSRKLPPVPKDKIICVFSAKILTENSADNLREFQMSYCPTDGTFAVVEKQIPNSGFPGGRFIGTTTVVNPATNKPYLPDDVTLGKEVTINAWRFKIVDAMDGTLKTMEDHSDLFTRSDIKKINAAILKAIKPNFKDVITKMQGLDEHNHRKIHKDDAFRILEEAGAIIAEQEKVTVFRKYRFANSDLFRYGDLLDDLTAQPAPEKKPRK